MPIYTHLYIKEQASLLIKQFGIEHPPVDVKAIAEKLGVDVMEMTSDSWFYGMLTRYEESFYIAVNKMMPETRKRFAIAHEIGHYQLHDHDLAYQREPEQDYRHREADIFAEELCMPAEMLKREAFNTMNNFKFLAKQFCVSEPMMVKKMEELKLLPKEKFSWYYADCR